MKVALVPKIKTDESFPSLEKLAELMDNQPAHAIDALNWKGYDYKPDVRFSLGYSEKEIFLKFVVNEKYFKAEMTEPNQNVYEDSCVEFFVSPENDGLYYNLEFNALGTCLLGSGHGRHDSRRADPGIISRIRRLGSSGNQPFGEKQGEFSWWLLVAIPYGIFFHHSVTDPAGKSFRANFYKCGDRLSVPHYVTWNPVGTEKPDFHRPEYFGELKFI